MPDGLTQVLGVASLSEVPPARLHEVMELLAAHSAAAQTLFTRWVEERQDEGSMLPASECSVHGRLWH